jgi:hypothetical protein
MRFFESLFNEEQNPRLRRRLKTVCPSINHISQASRRILWHQYCTRFLIASSCKATQEHDMAAKKKKWSHKVKTVSTKPPEGTFSKDAQSIARTMASKKVSPKGIGSGIRMIQFFINRAGKSLSQSRRRVLERAKRILQQKQARQSAR